MKNTYIWVQVKAQLGEKYEVFEVCSFRNNNVRLSTLRWNEACGSRGNAKEYV